MKMVTHFEVEVHGIPVAQGSMVRSVFGLRYYNHKALMDWRHSVMKELVHARPDGWDDAAPIEVIATFVFPRPASHFGTGKNASRLRPSAPEHKVTAPDLDKLTRACGDAIEEAGIVSNDAQICGWEVLKRYAETSETPGALLSIMRLP